MPRTSYLLLSLSLATLLACSSEPNQRRELPPGVPPLMGLDDEPAEPIWSKWSPESAPARPTPRAFREQAHVFDFLIADARQRRDLWDAAAALLEGLRLMPGLDRKTLRAVTALLSALESTSLQIDVSFLTRKTGGPGAWEGIVLRFAQKMKNGARPALAIFLRRDVGAGPEPQQLTIWAVPGFEQAPPSSIQITRKGAALQLRHARGIKLKLQPTKAAPEQLTLLRTVAIKSFWRPFTGNQYANLDEDESGQPRASNKKTESAAGLLPAALGEKLRDRRIELVYRDSVFPPRMTDFELDEL